MLSPEYLEHLPEPLVKLWQQVEDDILRDIARRIKKMDGLTDTAAYQAYRLEQTRLLHTDIAKLISKYSGKTEDAIRNMFAEAATETLRTEDAIHAAAGVSLPAPNKSEILLNLLNAGYQQTAGSWKNLTGTTANTVTRQFEDALDRAWLQVSSGAFDYKTAIRGAVHDLAQHMDGVTYPSGHHDSLEVAVRRAVLTGTNQTCGKLQWERSNEAGCEFVETTAHSGAREYSGGGPKDHAGWQGKVFHKGSAIECEGVFYECFEDATGYGTGDGICGWNCRHNFFSFWPGISVRAYTDERLAEYTAEDIEYNGQKYSRAKINEMQREKERKVRKYKKTWMMEKEAGLDTTATAIKLKNARADLADFAAATGGRVDSSRTATWNTSKLPGKSFGHSAAASANWDVRKAGSVDTGNYRDYNDSRDSEQHSRYRKVLGDKVPESLVEFQHMKRTDADTWDTLKKQYRVVNQYKVDSGTVSVEEILDLDDHLITEKRQNFTSRYKRSGNVAGAYVDGDYYLAHSKISSAEEVKGYKGDSKLVTLRDDRTFQYIDVTKEDGSVRTDTYQDTEAKLFEAFADMYGIHPFKSVTMISERGMCDSCKGVMEQFKAKFPDVDVRVISHKKVEGDVWKYRRRKK